MENKPEPHEQEKIEMSPKGVELKEKINKLLMNANDKNDIDENDETIFNLTDEISEFKQSHSGYENMIFFHCLFSSTLQRDHILKDSDNGEIEKFINGLVLKYSNK